jgi:hypothetical protein
LLPPQSEKCTKGAPGSTTNPHGEFTFEKPKKEFTVPGADLIPARVFTARVTTSNTRITL